MVQLLPERAAVYREYQRTPPTLEAQGAEAEQRELSAEVLEHLFERCAGRVAQPIRHATARRGTEAPPEIRDRLVAGAPAKVDQCVSGNEDVVPSAVDAASNEIEAHRA